jgi:hypothetical protein
LDDNIIYHKENGISLRRLIFEDDLIFEEKFIAYPEECSFVNVCERGAWFKFYDFDEYLLIDGEGNEVVRFEKGFLGPSVTLDFSGEYVIVFEKGLKRLRVFDLDGVEFWKFPCTNYSLFSTTILALAPPWIAIFDLKSRTQMTSARIDSGRFLASSLRDGQIHLIDEIYEKDVDKVIYKVFDLQGIPVFQKEFSMDDFQQILGVSRYNFRSSSTYKIVVSQMTGLVNIFQISI